MESKGHVEPPYIVDRLAGFQEEEESGLKVEEQNIQVS
jgi:hypothetical protein